MTDFVAVMCDRNLWLKSLDLYPGGFINTRSIGGLCSDVKNMYNVFI